MKAIRLRNKNINIVRDNPIKLEDGSIVYNYYNISSENIYKLGNLGIEIKLNKFGSISDIPMSSDYSKQEKKTRFGKDAKNYIGLKFRLYPNKEQRIFLNKTFGCCRKLYNLMLDTMLKHWNAYHEILDLKYTDYTYNPIYSYLLSVDQIALQYTSQNLRDAFYDWVKGNKGKPEFKRKYDTRMSFTTKRTGSNIKIDHHGNTWKVKLPKMYSLFMDEIC